MTFAWPALPARTEMKLRNIGAYRTCATRAQDHKHVGQTADFNETSNSISDSNPFMFKITVKYPLFHGILVKCLEVENIPPRIIGIEIETEPTQSYSALFRKTRQIEIFSKYFSKLLEK